ncbi:MAG TPA: hypothetical protein VG778_01500 [Blastocatellia bacterium]|nr:hypothetical protein [Blastocatellia bacterium]
MKRFRTTFAFIFVAGVVALLTTQSMAYPPFLDQAKKFGAKDCRFCHVKADGGDQHNARGKWLVKEKERRGADAVDPEWLVDYKPARKPKK